MPYLQQRQSESRQHTWPAVLLISLTVILLYFLMGTGLGARL